MRRITTTVVLAITLLAATPTFAAERDGGLILRIKHFIAHVLGHVVSTGDYITPPKP